VPTNNKKLIKKNEMSENLSTEQKLDIISIRLFGVTYKSLVDKNNYQEDKSNKVFKQYLKENAI
tara:strand:- start:1165 stop:1356 length:192 start_codon:yes stop_codon:yes gene_type:complete